LTTQPVVVLSSGRHDSITGLVLASKQGRGVLSLDSRQSRRIKYGCWQDIHSSYFLSRRVFLPFFMNQVEIGEEDFMTLKRAG